MNAKKVLTMTSAIIVIVILLFIIDALSALWN
jgi:hypothetical protein